MDLERPGSAGSGWEASTLPSSLGPPGSQCHIFPVSLPGGGVAVGSTPQSPGSTGDGDAESGLPLLSRPFNPTILPGSFFPIMPVAQNHFKLVVQCTSKNLGERDGGASTGKWGLDPGALKMGGRDWNRGHAMGPGEAILWQGGESGQGARMPPPMDGSACPQPLCISGVTGLTTLQSHVSPGPVQ